MPSKTKKKEKGRGGPVAGAVAGAISSVALLALCAIVLNKNSDLSEYAKAAIIGINILSSIICGSVATRGRESKKMLTAVEAGALYFVVIIISALSISLDNISTSGLCEIVLICLVGSAVGSMVHLCRSNKKLRTKGKRR